MRRLLAVMILSMPVCAVAGAPNAQDHAIAVHVTRSWIVNECTARGCSPTVHLNVLISGKKFELEDEKQRPVLLKPGDYRATLLRNPRAVNFAPAAYDDYRIYEFLFPDGKTRKYILVGEEE